MLQFVSKDLRRDREIVMTAVRKNGGAIKFASEDLWRDRDIVMAVVGQNGEALCSHQRI